MTQACMGGWCRHRGSCPNYHAADRSEPVERYCDKGADGMVTITATPWQTVRRNIFDADRDRARASMNTREVQE